MAYANIAGISRVDMKDNRQLTLAEYDGNARPGELVVDLTTYVAYIGNTDGYLTALSSGGNGGGSTATWATLGNKANSNGPTAIALGQDSGTGQGAGAIAFGHEAGNSSQAAYAVAIGEMAGQSAQAIGAVAIGVYAGQTSQGDAAVAIGGAAGMTSQSANTVAIGQSAATLNQGDQAVAIGAAAGYNAQGANSVAVGAYAGNGSLGANAIAIGAYAGNVSQSADSILLNATGTDIDPATAGFFVAPVRNASTANAVYYNTTNHEFTYSAVPVSGGMNVSVATGAFVYSATGDTDTGDLFEFASAAGKTTVNIGLAGTPVNGQRMTIRMVTVTGATLNWDATLRSLGPTLPAASTANKMIYVEAMYNGPAALWDVYLVTVQP